jgi:hypothetical protein
MKDDLRFEYAEQLLRERSAPVKEGPDPEVIRRLEGGPRTRLPARRNEIVNRGYDPYNATKRPLDVVEWRVSMSPRRP